MLAKDFKKFVELLTENKVEYLLVGGYAVGLHGYPRYTGDFDIWINPVTDNAAKVLKVVNTNDLNVNVINLADLLKNKRASGRHRDLDDLENLTKQ